MYWYDEIERTGVIEVEGVKFKVETKTEHENTIEKGDTYLAKRNTGWKLLTCKEHNREKGIVYPEMINGLAQYPFDSGECYKVLEMVE